MSTSLNLLNPMAGGATPPALHVGSAPAASGTKSVFGDLVAKHTATSAAMTPAPAHTPSQPRGATLHDQGRPHLQNPAAPRPATHAHAAPATARGAAGASTHQNSTAAHAKKPAGPRNLPDSAAINASPPDAGATAASDPDNRADAFDDKADDDTTTADRPEGLGQPAALPTPPVVALTLAPSAADAGPAAPVDVPTDAVDASAVPTAAASTPDVPKRDAASGQQVAAANATWATVPAADPAIDPLALVPDQDDGSPDVQAGPPPQNTSADPASAQKVTETLTTAVASPMPDAAGASPKATPSSASSQAVSDSVKPAAADAGQPAASSAQAGDPSKSTPNQKTASAAAPAALASSSSDQARAMLQAALAAHGHTRTATVPAQSGVAPSSTQSSGAVVNQPGSGAPATNAPVAVVPARQTPPPPPAPDGSAASAPPSGPGQNAASLLSAAIGRTQSADGGSFGASAGDGRGQSNSRTSGGPLTTAGATLASGASPLGASFSLPSAAAGQFDGAAGAQAPGFATQADAALPGQIVQAIRMQWQNGVGQATIRLDPAHLGELTVSLRVDQGTVNAQLHADTPEVRAWIQQHAQDLRGALEQQGLRLGQLAVAAVDPDGRRQPSARDQLPPRAPRSVIDTGARFTVQV